MNRREAIRNVAFMLGGTLTASTLFALTEGCNPKTSYAGGVDTTLNKNFSLNQQQQTLIGEIAETILPKTSTPGAKDAKVDEFIQMMLKDCYAPDDQQIMADGLVSFEQECKTKMNKSFIDLGTDDRKKFLLTIESGLFTKAVPERPSISDDHTVNSKKSAPDEVKKLDKPKTEPYHYYRVLKELTLLGYFTSEIGCTQALNYVKVPGRYDGSVKLIPGQKSWATS